MLYVHGAAQRHLELRVGYCSEMSASVRDSGGESESVRDGGEGGTAVLGC